MVLQKRNVAPRSRLCMPYVFKGPGFNPQHQDQNWIPHIWTIQTLTVAGCRLWKEAVNYKWVQRSSKAGGGGCAFLTCLMKQLRFNFSHAGCGDTAGGHCLPGSVPCFSQGHIKKSPVWGSRRDGKRAWTEDSDGEKDYATLFVSM